MEIILDKIKDLIPYPYIDDKGNSHDGCLKNIPKQCLSCNMACFIKNEEQSQISTCSKGFNFYKADLKDIKVTIFGITIKGHQAKLPRKQKKEFNELLVSIDDIKRWETKTNSLIEEIINYKDRKVKDNFALLHDIVPTISLIFRSVESLINKTNGSSFEEKVENSEYNLKTLYHAIDLLDNRLKIMPLIGNPESAKFGQVTKCSPYKIFDKVVRLYRETANRKNLRINLHSDKYITHEPHVYDSFMTLPFLLIENAIKYSKKNGVVDIFLKQNKDSVYISISSFGPIVKSENIDKIFNKGFKDPNAQKFSSKGSGIGLYLVDIVAKAHNINIDYKIKGDVTIENDIEMGNNIFVMELR
jgi:K+-sensing histidine kinase KdpD